MLFRKKWNGENDAAQYHRHDRDADQRDDAVRWPLDTEQAELLGNGIGFILQNFALVETKTVRENLEIVRRKNRSGVTLEDALTRVGLYGKADQKVYTLSGGEQQRVALARLFYKKNDVILADEPTGSLDSDNAGVVMDILRELNRTAKTVVLVTHNEDIKKMCDRIITL